MGRSDGNPENKLRGYKAAVTNPKVSDQARAHAQEEIDKYSGAQSDEERHEGNMKRGLKAAMHNPRNTGEGRSQARNKLQSMGEDVEPAD